jgi:hypothetical protein
MKKFYRINTKQVHKYIEPIDFNITDNKITVTSGEKKIDLTIDNLRNRADNTQFARFYFIANSVVNPLSGEWFLDLTGDIINLYNFTRKTKQSCDDYSAEHKINLPFSIVLQPHATDFSEVDISLYATPSDVITASGVDIEVIELNTNRNNKPKFKIEGSSTISTDAKETYKISYINRGTGKVDNSANYRVVINSNIGVLNKKDTNLIDGSTTITLDATGLTSGEKVTLEVGMYEYSNTSQLSIDVL